jgi:hypothetical protein
MHGAIARNIMWCKYKPAFCNVSNTYDNMEKLKLLAVSFNLIDSANDDGLVNRAIIIKRGVYYY